VKTQFPTNSAREWNISQRFVGVVTFSDLFIERSPLPKGVGFFSIVRFPFLLPSFLVALLRRFWAPAIILLMVAIHAAVIGYVRSRVARLSNLQSSAVEIGQLRFQNINDPDSIYQLQLHAVVDPSRYFRGEQRLTQTRMEIIESAEQTLRQVEPAWLADPAQQEIRERLMDVVLQNLDEPLVQRVLITDWLRVPNATGGAAIVTSPPML
jgi:hypothetical protein